MARSQLYVRWRKEKAQRRKTQPKSFGNRGTSTFYGHVKKTEAMFQGQARVPFAKNSAEYHCERLKFHIKRLKPHHVILHMLFETAIKQAAEADHDLDPKIATEILMARYAAQDTSLKVFQFDCIHMEHSEYHDKWLYFRGRSCCLVFRRASEVRRSHYYENVHFLKSLPLKKVQWAGEPYILSVEELKELSTNSQ